MNTSTKAPLRIAEVQPAGTDGMIGITFAPGKKQPDGATGPHDRDLSADLDVIAAWNAAVVVTLVEEHELRDLQIDNLGREVTQRFMEWHHWPIADFSVPAWAFDEAWPSRSEMLRGLLGRGGRVLIHCKGGLGRAGMIAARLLVECGDAPADAIQKVRDVRGAYAIETTAQEAWVARCRSLPTSGPDSSRDGCLDRAIGALVGLAIGDAVGTTIEFQPKPNQPLIHDMVGGGPFRLEAGEWTDDTAMALALAQSLLERPNLDASDLMDRFCEWMQTGAYSCQGRCFDIGNTVRTALHRYLQDQNPLAGPTDDESSGNGALMRLAPVMIRYWRDRSLMQRASELQTRTTHGSKATLKASRVFADMVADAISGASLATILQSEAAADIEGAWRGHPRTEIRGSGYVVHSLQAAVWAVARTTNFRSAVLLAANLGEDADTTAAITGQLAGAIYGVKGIPREWLDRLAWCEDIKQLAITLFDAGWVQSSTA
jgi:ADP-ribosyl-[dinitrogen reductase] hydrolase